MIRDRFLELGAARSDSSSDDNSSTEFELDTEMRDFFALVEQIKDTMEYIENCVAEVQTKQTILLSSMQCNALIKQHLELLMTEIQKNADVVGKKISSIKESIEEKQRHQLNSAFLRMQKIQFAGLTHRFVKIITNYNRSKIDFCELSKNRIQQQLRMTGSSISHEQLDLFLEHIESSFFTESVLSKQTIVTIQNKHADVMQIETSIEALYALFKDMQSLVDIQSDLVDSIEYNVTNATEYVDQAKQLTKAVLYQRRTRHKTNFVLLCLIIILFVIIFYVSI